MFAKNARVKKERPSVRNRWDAAASSVASRDRPQEARAKVNICTGIRGNLTPGSAADDYPTIFYRSCVL